MDKQDESFLVVKVLAAENLVFEICHVVFGDWKGCHSPFFLGFFGLIGSDDVFVNTLLRNKPFNRSGEGLFPSMLASEMRLPIVVSSGRKHFQY
jgi:hypothetical protein